MNLKPYYRLPARGGTPTWVKVADSQNRMGLVAYKEYIYIGPLFVNSEGRFSKYNTRTRTHTYFGPSTHTIRSYSSYISEFSFSQGALVNGFLYWAPAGHNLPDGTINQFYKVDPNTDTVTREGGVPDNFECTSFAVYNKRYLYTANAYGTAQYIGKPFAKHDTQTGTTTLIGSKESRTGSSGICLGKDERLYAIGFGRANHILIEIDPATDTFSEEPYLNINKNDVTVNINNFELGQDDHIYFITKYDNGKITKVNTDTRTVTKITTPDTDTNFLTWGKKSQQICAGAANNKKTFLFSIGNGTITDIDPQVSLVNSIVEDNTGTFYALFSNNALHKLEYQ